MGGYEDLVVYHQAVLIYDLNYQFCEHNLRDLRYKRTVEQMVQAARSGKQNIVEGSIEKSSKLGINLTSVARASFGELLEDYRDFLRVRGLELWSKDDTRLIHIRSMKVGSNWSNEANWANSSNWSNLLKKPESFANVMITLISKETYLLDQMVRSLEQKFITTGGYSENLFKKRLEQRRLDKLG